MYNMVNQKSEKNQSHLKIDRDIIFFHSDILISLDSIIYFACFLF